MSGRGTILVVAQAMKTSESEAKRRRAAAERIRGMFSDVASERSLVDELIADRRAEVRAEGAESAPRRRRSGG